MTDKQGSDVSIGGSVNITGAGAIGAGASATQSGTVNAGSKPPPESPAAPGPDESPSAASVARTGGLPPFRAVLAVDAERSTEIPSARLAQFSEDIVGVLEAAFVRAGLGDDWRERRFRMQSQQGDGYVVGLMPEALPQLLHPFLHELQEELRRRDRTRLASEPRLRLRASIHVGPLPDAGRWTDGVGKPMADTHRLLDSAEVRRLLSQTHREVTFLAVIVSGRVYEEVVQAGFTELHPDEFTPVVATAKRFAEQAYLYLPQHSTDRAAGPQPA